MKESDFAALNAHLEEVRPIFDEFCARHGFAYVDRQAIGRYPRVRIKRAGPVTLWFDLWMEMDKDGRRFERFERDHPYELSAGASVDVPEGGGARFFRAIQCFSGKPFDRVGAVLRSEMENHLHALEGWDAQFVQATGKRVPLGKRE